MRYMKIFGNKVSDKNNLDRLPYKCQTDTCSMGYMGHWTLVEILAKKGTPLVGGEEIT